MLLYCDVMIDFEFECMSVEDLVQEMFLVEAFVDDVQKFSSKVSFNVGVPWGLYHTMFLFLLRVARSQTLIISFHNYHLATSRIVYIASI